MTLPQAKSLVIDAQIKAQAARRAFERNRTSIHAREYVCALRFAHRKLNQALKLVAVMEDNARVYCAGQRLMKDIGE